MIVIIFFRRMIIFYYNKFKNQLFLLFLIFISFTLFNSFYFPVYIDEAVTYNDYVSKGFWEVISSYKEPNNHVFYSLLLVLFTKLPIDTLIAMRLLNVMIALCVIIIMYRYLKMKFSQESATIGLCFFMFSYFFLFYTIFARGYLIIILCTISYFFVLEKIETQAKNKYFIVIGIISFIGFCTIPIFLYVFISFLIIIFFRFIQNYYSKRLIFSFLLTYTIVVLCVFLFYIPILMYEGVGAIVNNKWTTILSYNDIYSYLKDSWNGFYDKIFGVKSIYIMLSIILIGTYLLITKKKSRLFLLENFTFIFLPFIFILLHKVIPGVRTWSYLIVPFTIILTFYIETFSQLFTIKKTLKQITTSTVCLLLCLCQLLIFHRTHKTSGHINDFYYGQVVDFLSNKNFEHICFLNGSRSYENVIYTFRQNTDEKHFKVIKNGVFQEVIFVSPITDLDKSKHKKVLYFNRKINLFIYQLLK